MNALLPKMKTEGLFSGGTTLKNLLVPIDFSRVSHSALEYAIPLAGKFGAKISLVHAMEPLPYGAGILGSAVDEDFLIQTFGKELADLAAAAIEPERFGQTVVRLGPAYEVIANTARDLRADLIVLTTHGQSCLKHVFMGSTAERVVRYAPCPVLVVRRCEYGVS
jgi:nucleotide-binding universal stress UspA family protein